MKVESSVAGRNALLLYALPTRQNTERVNFWRKLKKFGAVALQTSGHVLPDEPEQFERLQWLSKEIRDAGALGDDDCCSFQFC